LPENEKPYGAAVWEVFCQRLAEACKTLEIPGAPRGALDQAEGARYLSRVLRLGLEIYLEGGDPDFPTFVRPSHETAKLGGDNPDNLYLSATIAGDREYRLRGNIGTVTFLSVGSKANRYATDGTMVSTGELSAEDFGADADGEFTIVASRNRPAGDVAWLPLAQDSNIIQIRQTFIDRAAEIPATFMIERTGSGPAMPPPSDPEMLRKRLMGAADFVVNSTRLFAGWAEKFMSRPNEMCDWGQEMFHKAGGDPAIFYIHGYWTLAPNQALVIETETPDCEHWNIQVNNWWMESLDYRYIPANINKGSAVADPDGKVRIWLAHEDLGKTNWLATHGHGQGFLLLRWVRATSHPIPTVRVVKAS